MRCEGCDHPGHDGRTCGFALTKEIDDTVGLFCKPSGMIFSLIVGRCKCGRPKG